MAMAGLHRCHCHLRLVRVVETLLSSARLFLAAELPIQGGSEPLEESVHDLPTRALREGSRTVLCSCPVAGPLDLAPQPVGVGVFATQALVGWCTCSTGR